MPSAGATRMAAGASSTRCATPPAITSSPPTRSARPRPRRRRQRVERRERAACAPASGGRIDRSRPLRFHFRRRAPTVALPATRSPRRCSPTACISRPLVQIPPPARHPGRRRRGAERARGAYAAMRLATPRIFARPRSSSTRGSWRRARTAGRASRSMSARSTICSSPFIPAGFYYKTFMWPRARVAVALRAAHPRRRGPRARARRSPTPTATRSATPIATCWSSARARPASPPRSPPPPPARASSCATSRRSSGGSLLCQNRRRLIRSSTGVPRPTWLARTARGAAPRTHASRCCRAPPPSATSRITWSASTSGSPIISPTPPAQSAARAAVAGARAARWCSPPAPSSGRWCSRETTGPGSCWPARPAPISTAMACAPGTRAVVVTACDEAYRGGARAAAGRRIRRDDRRRAPAAQRRGCGAMPRGSAAFRCRRQATVLGTQRTAARRAAIRLAQLERRVAGTHGTAASPATCVLMSGGFTPSVHLLLAVARQAAPGTRRLQAFLPGTGRRARALGRRVPRRVRPRRCAGRWSAAGAAARAKPRSRTARRARRSAQRALPEPPRTPPRGDGRGRRRPAPAHRAARRQGLRRLAERCHHARTSRSPRAKASARSSTSSATPPPAWRPTRARPPT